MLDMIEANYAWNNGVGSHERHPGWISPGCVTSRAATLAKGSGDGLRHLAWQP